MMVCQSISLNHFLRGMISKLYLYNLFALKEILHFLHTY
jgi:hypothetical protein